MTRVKLTLSFDGTPFSGFQVQPNAPSVQGALNDAFRVLYQTDIPVCGCSRTDAGVHAKEFVCHADLPNEPDNRSLVKSLNALLPREISVFEAQKAPPEFHARYSAKTKTYRYFIWNHSSRAPLLSHRALHYPYPVEEGKLQKAASALCGTHDFRAFLASGSDISDTVRTVTACSLTRRESLLIFEISADGFLYHMVRNILGTLLDIGTGKLTLSMEQIIASRDRNCAGFCAPPDGLYLWRIDY